LNSVKELKSLSTYIAFRQDRYKLNLTFTQPIAIDLNYFYFSISIYLNPRPISKLPQDKRKTNLIYLAISTTMEAYYTSHVFQVVDHPHPSTLAHFSIDRDIHTDLGRWRFVVSLTQESVEISMFPLTRPRVPTASSNLD